MGVVPDDPTALHCKVVCLVQLSKFEEAYKFIEKNRLSSLAFEKAYCEYRLNKQVQALKTIDDTGLQPLPPNLKELRTQVLYRLERYDECLDAYRDIIKNTSDDYEDERRTNLSAVAANLAVDKNKDVPEVPEDTYEQYFNSASILLNRQKYAEAERKLRTSEKLCREFLEEEGASEEEIIEEVDVIRVQLAYCLQQQGKIKEAATIYADCLRHKPKDAALVAVASNNSVVINKDQNVFDSKKKIRAALADACEPKLTSRQKQVIALNNCLLALYTNAGDQVQQLSQKLAQTYPQVEFEALLIRCTQLAKDRKHKEAIEQLQKFASTHKSHAFVSKFAVIQLQLLQVSFFKLLLLIKSTLNSYLLSGKSQGCYRNATVFGRGQVQAWCCVRPRVPLLGHGQQAGGLGSPQVGCRLVQEEQREQWRLVRHVAASCRVPFAWRGLRNGGQFARRASQA